MTNKQPRNSERRSSSNLWNYIAIAGLIVTGLILLLALPNSAADRAVFARTVMLGICASLIAIPLGGLIAWVCSAEGTISRILMVASLALLLVPMFIHVSGWDAAFGKLGWLTSSSGQVLVPLVSGWTAASWIHGLAAAPQVALILLIGLQMGDRSYEEQALLETSSTSVFWNITFPRIAPLLILCVVWNIVFCAREIAVTDLYQIGTLAEQIYLGYSLGINSVGGNWSADQLAQAGNINSRLTVAIVGWLSAVSLFLFTKMTALEFYGDQVSARENSNCGWKQNLIGVLILILLVGVPIGNVLLRASFYVLPIAGVPTQGYSINQVFNAITRSALDYQNEFAWSFLIALCSATLILAMATVFGFAARKSRGAQIVLAVAMAIACALPGPTIGTLIAGLFSNLENGTLIHWIYNYTIAGPVLANFIFCWPLGTLIVWFVFRKVPEDSLDAANVDGAGWLTRLSRFGLAENRAALIGCWFVTFALSFGELSASQIVRPAGMDTVPRKMLGDLHAGVNEMTAGITIVTAFTVVAISLIGWYFIGLNRGAISRR